MPLTLSQKLLIGITCLAGLMTAMLLILNLAVRFNDHLFVNLSASAPLGLWSIRPLSQPLQRGDWVIACPPLEEQIHDRLFDVPFEVDAPCPTRLMLKQVAAMEGDEVKVAATRIQTPWITVETQHDDARGFDLPRLDTGTHPVEADQVWLINGWHPYSVDSRYYGAVPNHSIEKQAQPILTLTLDNINP